MKVRTLKLTDYFQIKNPKYAYIQVIPHKSVKNCDTSGFAKTIATTYKSLDKRIRREKKKLIVESSFKISYVVDITADNMNFYFIVPDIYKNILAEKTAEIWNKATIKLVDGIPPVSGNVSVYELGYKNDDALSLKVDKKNCEPLNQIVAASDTLEGSDRVIIAYNFRPTHLNWNERYENTIKKIAKRENVMKTKLSGEYIAKEMLSAAITLIGAVISIINDIAGENGNKAEQKFLDSVTNPFDASREISESTRRKKTRSIISTQIAVLSESENEARRELNAKAICDSYSCIAENNELVPRKLKKKKKLDLEANDLGISSNYCSADEIKNFIQIPQRSILENGRIDYINIEETPLPDELKNGTKCLGTVTYKGKKEKAYLENEYNIGNLPLVTVGAQGSGKTSLLINNVMDCSRQNEGVVIIDFIKGCEFSETVLKHVPKEKVVKLNLAEESDLQGFGYNEIKMPKNATPYQRLEIANRQSQLVMSFIDSVCVGDPLSSRMRRFLHSAATVVFSLGYTSIKDVVKCLEDYRARDSYIREIPEDLAVYLEDDIHTLDELDDMNKGGQVCGTKASKIEHVLDRVSTLREDFKLKMMYNHSLDSNIDLVDCLEKGKIVIIQMPQASFPTKAIINIMVTYWISKVWLSAQIRGNMHEKPLRANIIVDEVSQAPTCMETLSYILPQARKFGYKFIFSTQCMSQLDSIADILEASGSSYMLLKGCLEDDFKHLKNKIDGFDFEDLKNMEKYSSLNCVYYSKGYASFITKMPPALK